MTFEIESAINKMTLPFTENIFNDGLIISENKLIGLTDKHLTEI